MLAHLADVSIRSLLLALSAALVVWTLRSKRTAALQHAVWTAVVCGTLALFAFGSALPRLPLRVLDRPASAPLRLPRPPSNPPLVGEMVELPAPIPTTPRRAIDWSEVAIYSYAAIALAFLVRFITGMFLVRGLLRGSKPGGAGFHESELIAVPLTVGLLRPKIVLPLEWREWDREKLDAVLAHEGAHARRRDGLVAALAGINRSIFWFHPLAWWMERRLALLAELACDESCVATLGNRERYARLLLDMALVVDGAHGRLQSHALTMAAPSHLRRRIDLILKDGRKPSRGLTWTGWTAVALCGVPIVLGAGAVELAAPPPRLPPPGGGFTAPAPPPPHPALVAQARSVAPSPSLVAPLQFEVASIRPSAPVSLPPGAGGRGGGPPGGGNGCGQLRFTMDAGRIDIRCTSLEQLISYAFGIPLDRITGPEWMMIRPGPHVPGAGGPQFDISAKLPEGASEDQVPAMLQNLLADRFRLAVHRGSKEQPGYALVVDKSGLKVKEAAPDATDANAPLPPCPPQAPRLRCSMTNLNGVQTRTMMGPNADGGEYNTVTRSNPLLGTARQIAGPKVSRLEAPKTTFPGLAGLLSPTFGSVVDMTGLNGRYDVVLDLSVSPSEWTNQSPPPTPDQISDDIQKGWRDALKKIGLLLEPRKVPVETIVVDHLEKTPTEN
jgi:uncharacterized protein (TIGR03435 family)